MSPDCRIYAAKEEAAQAAGEHILKALQAARNNNRRATLAVSGGSTPRWMFERMAAADFDWEGVHIFWVDERCVPPADPESNYRLAKEALLGPAGIPEQQIHRVRGELPPEQAASDYVQQLWEFFDLSEGRLPVFDVVHLGMGADAHTASLFPGDPLISDRKHLAAAIYSEARQSHRVSLLPGVLLRAGETVFLVTGADKAATLRQVFSEELDPRARPAQMVAQQGRNVRWFLDEPAAAEIR